jgi:AraC-like DNA-binding protein
MMASDLAAPGYFSTQVEASRLFWFDERDGAVDVVSGGFERCAGDYRIDRDGFQWPSFEMVLGGGGEVRMEGRSEALRTGVFYIYGPGVKHEIIGDKDRHLVKYFVSFRGERLAAKMSQLGLVAGMISETTRVESMARIFDELIDRGARHSGLSQDFCVTLVELILMMAAEDSLDAGLADTRAFRTYQRVRDFIQTRYLDVTTLDGVAAACDLDAAYLCRLFARFQDERPYQFLTRLRMEHAANRLVGEKISVKQVSEEMGFSDPFHFSRVFKSVHRVPPSKFRGGRS